jgi:hypothetical protein
MAGVRTMPACPTLAEIGVRAGLTIEEVRGAVKDLGSRCDTRASTRSTSRG